MLQPGKISKGMIVTRAAHLKRGTQVVAYSRSIRVAEDAAAIVVGKLHATHTSRFAIGHAGDGS